MPRGRSGLSGSASRSEWRATARAANLAAVAALAHRAIELAMPGADLPDDRCGVRVAVVRRLQRGVRTRGRGHEAGLGGVPAPGSRPARPEGFAALCRRRGRCGACIHRHRGVRHASRRGRSVRAQAQRSRACSSNAGGTAEPYTDFSRCPASCVSGGRRCGTSPISCGRDYTVSSRGRRGSGAHCCPAAGRCLTPPESPIPRRYTAPTPRPDPSCTRWSG